MEYASREIWFRTSWCDVNSGIIKSTAGMGHAWIMITHTDDRAMIGLMTCVHINDIYLTKDELDEANQARFGMKVCEYQRQMPDPASFAVFCYTHDMGPGKDADRAAREAARIQMKELFGINAGTE